MTDKEVLQKAIEKAIDNGWDNKPHIHFPFSDEFSYLLLKTERFKVFIFSHDFAKAFFPKEIAKMTWYEELKPYSFEDVESWKVHLMKMVLCSNPIDYLRPFLDNTETL